MGYELGNYLGRVLVVDLAQEIAPTCQTHTLQAPAHLPRTGREYLFLQRHSFNQLSYF